MTRPGRVRPAPAPALVTALVAALGLSLTACPRRLDEGPRASATRTLYLGGAPVAEIVEARVSAGGGSRVQRESVLLPGRDDRSVVTAHLDARGFLTRASYAREGARGSRRVELAGDGTGRWLAVPGRALRAPLPSRPLVLLDTLHLVDVGARVDVAFVDLASGDFALGAVLPVEGGTVALDERGQWIARATRDEGRVGPGAFEETGGRPEAPAALAVSPVLDDEGAAAGALPRFLELVGLTGGSAPFALDGPGQRAVERSRALRVQLEREIVDVAPPEEAHREPALFLESDDPRIVAFATSYAKGGAAADALALAEAIGKLLDTSKGGGPPSALSSLERRAGDCDDATALLVASLRALGHPARAVVGYRLWRGRLEPHAWGEVHTERGWLPVDALVPGLGPFDTHLRLFEGLGSPLTMGRVLGLVRPRAAP